MQPVTGYALGKSLHRGVRSEVQAAVRERDGREVVLKGFRGGADGIDAEICARHELDILQKVQGPGIPAALEVTWSAGMPVLVLEHARGLSLGAWVGGSLPSPQAFLDVFIQLVHSVSRVHCARLIHCDISPANIVIDPETRQAQLIDFELARPLGAASRGGETKLGSNSLEGTLPYISPEATGRMDRGLDSRSDLYSLGATMYFALTGRTPFESDDTLAMIHAHMAVMPVTAGELRPELPATLSRIVSKLLQKSPEDRYQTAHALGRDLEECRQQLSRTGTIQSDFPLGTADAPYRPLFPKRLYGREREIALLQEAYARAVSGVPAVITVEGAPGLGKSVLVHELRTRLVETGGYLACGKFDLYRQDLPYAGLAQALSSLAHQILTESDARLARWRESMCTALGAIAGALVGLVPDLGLVLGEVPPVPLLAAAETRRRLGLALQRLVRALAIPEHPLVLFLDDLQCADAASREVLRELLLENRTGSLLLIGAYRDTEVEPGHPLLALIADLRDAGVRIDSVQLTGLGEDACAQMLAHALGRSTEVTRPLATCVARKTGNSPLLIQQFIYHMYDLGLIHFDAPHGWSWDNARLEAAEIPDGAVALMTAKISRLPPAVAAVLELASCVGDDFDLDILAELSGRASVEIEASLFTLSDEGLIAPSPRGFRFVHDRIREAAQSLLSSQARSELHRQAARRLLEHTPAESLLARAFEIADHLNAARDRLEPAERLRALEVNLLAGKRALVSGAAVTAVGYLRAAREYFEDGFWQSQPALGLDLFMQSAEGALQTRDFDAAIQLLDVVDQQPLERMAAAASAAKRITAEAQRRPMEEVVPLLLEILARFGVHWPARPGRWRARWEIWRTDWALRGVGDGSGLLPFGSKGGGELLAPIVIMSAGGAVTAVGSPLLLCFILSFVLRGYVRYGYISSPALTLAGYAWLHPSFSRNVARTLRIAQAAQEWSQRVPHPVVTPKTEYLLHTFVYSWLRSRRGVLEPLRVLSERLFEVGDFEYGFYALVWRTTFLASVGERLELVEREEEALAERTRSGNDVPERLKARAVRLLRSGPPSGTGVDAEIAAIEQELRASEAAYMGAWAIWAMVLAVLGRFEAVLRCPDHAGRFTSNATDISFFRGLAAAALAGSAGRRGGRAHRRIAREALRRVGWLATLSAEIEHTHRGLRAECARMQGRTREALVLYAQAADGAAKQGYRHHAALLHERRAELLASLRRDTEAASARARAAALYDEWGAKTKVEELRREAVGPAGLAASGPYAPADCDRPARRRGSAACSRTGAGPATPLDLTRVRSRA